MNSPTSDQFDPHNAALLAGFAEAAYHARPDLLGWKTTVVECETTDTRALVASDGEDCVVTFRGTQDLRNWLTDLDCAFIRVGPQRIHRGFGDALESIHNELKSAIEGTHCQRVWLTGHSLGGALAMLFASGAEISIQGLYTFGQPRVGDAHFARDYNERLRARTFRLVRANDIVPRVPWMLGTYRHAGHEIFFPQPFETDQDGELIWVQDRGPIYKLPWDCLNLMLALRRGDLALLDDHHISRYLALFSAGAETSIHS